MKRPSNITDEHLEYLDDIKDSNVINMMGATPYVETEFCVDRKEAKEIIQYWMKTFGKTNR